MSASARANIIITASSSMLASGLAKARSTVSKWAAGMAKGIGAISGNSTVGNIVGNMQGKAMSFVQEQAKSVMELERGLTRFGIAAKKSPEALRAMRTSIEKISKETAIASSEILGGAQTYVDLTGDVKGAENAMRSFSRIAQASGSSVSDIATATASMQMSMGLDSADIEKVFSGLIVQGKAGAVSLKDMAGELSTLGPMMAKFKGGGGVEGIRSMGAAFQVVRQGAGSAAEANTQLQSVITGVISHAKIFEKNGVKIFDKHPKTGVKTLKSFSEIIDNISKSKLMKDPTALGKAFGRTEALAAFNTLSKNRDLYQELLVSAQDTTAVQKDMDTYLQSSAGKMDTAFNTLKLTIAEALTPERIVTFVGALTKVGEWMAKIVGYIEKAVSYAEDLKEKVMGPSVDKRVENVNKRADAFSGKLHKDKDASYEQMAAAGNSRDTINKLKDIERKSMLEAAQKERTKAAAIYTKGSYTEDEEVEAKLAESAARRYEARAAQLDPFAMQGPSIDKAQFAKRYAMADPDKFEKYDIENLGAAAKPVVEQMLGMMLGELRKFNAGEDRPIEATIVADGNKIAKTTANATDNHRAP